MVIDDGSTSRSTYPHWVLRLVPRARTCSERTLSSGRTVDSRQNLQPAASSQQSALRLPRWQVLSNNRQVRKPEHRRDETVEWHSSCQSTAKVLHCLDSLTRKPCRFGGSVVCDWCRRSMHVEVDLVSDLSGGQRCRRSFGPWELGRSGSRS